jgi:hypothetical protein
VTVPLTESRTDEFGNRYPMTLPLDVFNAAFVEAAGRARSGLAHGSQSPTRVRAERHPRGRDHGG